MKTVDKSISMTATRKQMLKVYTMVLKKGPFNVDNAIKNFKAWFKSHRGSLEQSIIARYVNEVLSETEKRLKQVRESLEEDGYSEKKGGIHAADGREEKRPLVGPNCRGW